MHFLLHFGFGRRRCATFAVWIASLAASWLGIAGVCWFGLHLLSGRGCLTVALLELVFIDFPSLWKRRWRLCSKVAPAIGAEMAVQIVQPSLYQFTVPALVSASVLFLFERMVPLPRPKSGTSCPQAVTAARNIAQTYPVADAVFLVPSSYASSIDTCLITALHFAKRSPNVSVLRGGHRPASKISKFQIRYDA